MNKSPYPPGFLFGRGEANPFSLTLTGLKLARCLLDLQPMHGRVLELGCGGGQYLRALRHYRPDLDIFGVDISLEAVAECLRVPGATCCQADVAALPFREGTFSAVVGFDILEHVLNPDRVLAESYRVLAPGGLLHLYVPCEGNRGTIYARRGHALKKRWGGHVQQFTTEGLWEKLRAAGYVLVQFRHSDHWLTQHLDYAFFRRLARSPHPERLWAAQALAPGGGIAGRLLRLARRLLSALSWLEGRLRSGRRGAMGVHITARKSYEAEPAIRIEHRMAKMKIPRKMKKSGRR